MMYGNLGMLLVGRTRTGQMAHAIPAPAHDPNPLAHNQGHGRALCGAHVSARPHPFRAAARFACKRCAAASEARTHRA
jgi:hypothetical protein